MKFKNLGITSIITIIIVVILVLYLCFSSLSVSYGYKKTSVDYDMTLNKLTVIIDAGHGGIDPGAVGNGLVEKDLNLSVAKKLGCFLNLSDVNVVFTRTDDDLLGDGDTIRAHKVADLKERLCILEKTENAIFVSIHMNKFTTESIHGLQTFYSTAEANSQKLAQHIQSSVKMLDADNNREVKPDDGNIFILKNATKTAVLVECGFISNPEEAALLSTDEYQNSIAFVIYTGIINYIQENKL